MIHQFGCRRAGLGDLRQERIIGFEFTPRRDHWMQRNTRLYRIFEIGFGINPLGRIAAQVFDQLDRIGPVLGAFQDPRAADIDVGAAAVLVGKDNVD